MTADDFSYYSQYMPSCYFRLGTSTNNEQFTIPVHNAKFDIDETAIQTGMGLMAWLAVQAIGKE
jgi:hippurate hydrolase